MKPRLPVITHIKINTAYICDWISGRVFLNSQERIQYAKPKPRYIVLCLIALFPWDVLAQTTIAARRTPAEVAVAADSKGEVVNERITTTLSSECKIRPVGKYFFAASGL